MKAAIGSLILSLIIAVGVCLTLDLQTYIESGGLASTVIYYVFTFISFESILGITNGLISTPVEEGPVERITEGLQRGGKTRWKLFYIQIFTCLAGLSCPESQREGIIFVFGNVSDTINKNKHTPPFGGHTNYHSKHLAIEVLNSLFVVCYSDY